MGRNGQAVQVDLRPTDPADEWMYPAPADVRALIRPALAAGWAPATIGGTFELPARTLP